MRISFGILAHNETDSLEKLLDTLVVKRPYKYEIVVIHDNGRYFNNLLEIRLYSNI